MDNWVIMVEVERRQILREKMWSIIKNKKR